MVQRTGHFDPLTQLPLGADVRQQIVARTQQVDGQFSLAIVGVDHLRRLNQTHGYDGGDAVLRTIAERLVNAVGHNGFVGRLGGARFVIIIEELGAADQAATAVRILDAVRRPPLQINSHRVQVDASIGVASMDHLAAFASFTTPAAPQSAQLIALADIALMSARAQGGCRVQVADTTDLIQQRHLRESQVVELLEDALENQGFRLLSQRMESLGNRWTESAKPSEVLLRLSDPQAGIGPDIFIPIAEHFGLIDQIDLWVLHHLLHTANPTGCGPSRRVGRTRNPRWFINLSPQSCETQGFAGQCEALILSSAIPPDLLCFELTETAAIHHLDAVQAFVDRLHSLGCWVALDDFGSGQSSLAHLGELDIDFLKIDGSLVREVDTDRRARALIGAIDSVAAAYGIRTIAEHVETRAEAAVLGQLGIDLGQGWLFDRPQALTA